MRKELRKLELWLIGYENAVQISMYSNCVLLISFLTKKKKSIKNERKQLIN